MPTSSEGVLLNTAKQLQQHEGGGDKCTTAHRFDASRRWPGRHRRWNTHDPAHSHLLLSRAAGVALGKQSSDCRGSVPNRSTHSLVGNIYSRSIATELHVSSYRRVPKLSSEVYQLAHHAGTCNAPLERGGAISTRVQKFSTSAHVQSQRRHGGTHPAVDGRRASSDVDNESKRRSRRVCTRISPAISVLQQQSL